MTYSPDISIIIPVYNAALFLKDCLSSLISQSLGSFEIICVDDGSVDDSVYIVSMFAQKDKRIKLICQRNCGAGMARNTGLSQATGKYVLFLDADDFFEPEMLKELFLVAEKDEADIVVFNADKFDNVDNSFDCSWSVIYFYPDNKTIFSPQAIQNDIFTFTVPAPWNKLFKRNFITKEKLSFQNIKSTNDLAFVFSAISSCSKISILDKVFVHYRVNNPNSLQGNGDKDVLDAFRALTCLKGYLVDKEIFQIYSKSFYELVGGIGVYTLSGIPEKRFKKQVMFNQQLLDYLRNLLPSVMWVNFDYKIGNYVIYGAGNQAILLVKCMIDLLNIDSQNIKITVTESYKDCSVCGIPVQNIEAIPVNKEGRITICASNLKSRINMVKTAKKIGYSNITCLSDIDVMMLCYGLCK